MLLSPKYSFTGGQYVVPAMWYGYMKQVVRVVAQ